MLSITENVLHKNCISTIFLSYRFCNSFMNVIVLGIIVASTLMTSSAVNISFSSEDYTWSHGKTMPTKRLEVSGVALDGKIYIIGGADRRGTKNIVETYDLKSNKWSSVSSLPQRLDHTAAATYNGKVYVIGGFNSTGASTNFLFIYDPTTNKWKQGKSMPTPRGALTAKFVDGILYAIGGDGTVLYDKKGFYNPQGIVNANEAYNPKTNSWKIKAAMPTSRDHLASAKIHNKIFVIGGRQPWGGPLFKDLDKNEMYDPQKDAWTTLTPLPTNRSGLSAASADNKIFVFGGESIRQTFNVTEKYDPITNSWTKEPSMPSARHGLAAVAIDNKIYVIAGGPKPGGSGSDINEIFNLN
jgi:N-acetylneuraminic acid mutarotase